MGVGQQCSDQTHPHTALVLSTHLIAPPCTLLMAFGFSTDTKTTPHNNTAPMSSPAPNHLLLACGLLPWSTSMSRRRSRRAKVSWLSLTRSVHFSCYLLVARGA